MLSINFYFIPTNFAEKYYSTVHGEHPRNVHLKDEASNGTAKKASTRKWQNPFGGLQIHRHIKIDLKKQNKTKQVEEMAQLLSDFGGSKKTWV